MMMAAALCLGAAGCERSEQGQTTVRFWAMGKEAEVVAELVDEFERQNPGIKVDVQNIPMTAAHEKLLTAFAADGLPDVCQLGNTWLPEFALLDTLEPMQPYVARSSIVDPKDYFPGVWDTNLVDGTLYGVPWYVDTRLLFYRKDLLREAGYTEMPKTWAEMEQVMAAIKRHVGPDRYAILMPLNEFEQQLSFALQQDDRLLRDHDNYGNFRGEGFRKALGFYDTMYQKGWAPRSPRPRSPTSGTNSSTATTRFTCPGPGTCASSSCASRRAWKASGAPRRCRAPTAWAPALRVAPAW